MKYVTFVLILFLYGCNTPNKAVKDDKGDTAVRGGQMADKRFVGFGKQATGGNNGIVIQVKSYDEFINAINQTGKRNINLRADIQIPSNGVDVANGDLTIYGNFHRIYGGEFRVRGKNMIFEDIFFACTDNGYPQNGNFPDCDTIGLRSGAEDIVFINCMMAWSVDENIGIYGDVKNVTFQQCDIFEALRYSHHKEGSHSMGILLNGGSLKPREISFINCLVLGNRERNIRAGDGATGEVLGCIFKEFRRTSDMSPNTNFTFIDNLWLKGNTQIASSHLIHDTGSGVRVYASGNDSDFGAKEVENSIIRLNTPEVYSGNDVLSANKYMQKIKARVDNLEYEWKERYLLHKNFIYGDIKIINSQTQSVLNK